MIEANIEVYEARSLQLTKTSQREGKILFRFRQKRAGLEEDGEPMTGPQKIAALGKLSAAKAEREAAAILVDEAFDATTPIET